MRSPSTVQVNLRIHRDRVSRRYGLVVLFAVLCGLVGPTTDAAWAQPPLGVAAAGLPMGPPAENPEIINFMATQYPGESNWLVSGQIVGCEFPGDIDVAIYGVVNASAITDSYGYFEVIVSYSGSVDMVVADASYEGVPLQQVACAIGF